MTLEDLKDKKVMILGLGREGIDTFRFLRKVFPNKILGVGDKLKMKDLRLKIKDRNVKWHLGKNYLKAIDNYDVVIKSPGIPIHLPEVEKALKEGKITSQTEIFFENCPGKIVGVTGTKGKSTTATLIYKILKKGAASLRRASPFGRGLKVHLVGNIGKPVLLLLFTATPNDVYVYELSSHQLLTLKKSPQIAVILNIYPEHLDYYKNFKEYINAKANITHYQKKDDFLIYNSRDKIVKGIAKKSKAKRIAIKGEYYFLNKVAAKAVGKIFGISEKNIIEAIRDFKSLPHRLEFIGEFKGIKFYNDSLSTVPETAIAAIDTLGEKVKTIILGGFDREQNFKNLAKKILENKINTVILFPTTGERIWQALRLASLGHSAELSRSPQGKKLPRHFFVDNIKETVKLSYQFTERGKICLLSPASASFNLFKDYRERGNLFKKFVKILGK